MAGEVRHGKMSCGVVGYGLVRFVMAVMVWLGECGEVRRGKVRYDKLRFGSLGGVW